MSVVSKAIGIATAEIAARIQKIMQDNESFDGEISPEDLAALALNPRSTPAPKPVTAPVARAAARGAGKTCKRCGVDHLNWQRIDGRWVLHEQDGSRHSCPRLGETGVMPTTGLKLEERVPREHWHRLVEIITQFKKDGISASEAPNYLDYAPEETPAPKSVIDKAVRLVYREPRAEIPKPTKPESFTDSLKKV
jgi:hypothetical protein